MQLVTWKGFMSGRHRYLHRHAISKGDFGQIGSGLLLCDLEPPAKLTKLRFRSYRVSEMREQLKKRAAVTRAGNCIDIESRNLTSRASLTKTTMYTQRLKSISVPTRYEKYKGYMNISVLRIDLARNTQYTASASSFFFLICLPQARCSESPGRSPPSRAQVNKIVDHRASQLHNVTVRRVRAGTSPWCSPTHSRQWLDPDIWESSFEHERLIAPDHSEGWCQTGGLSDVVAWQLSRLRKLG